MSIFKTFLYGLTASLALSLSAAQAFAACTPEQEKAAGYKIAAAARDDLGDTTRRQSARLIKIDDCSIVDDVTYASFTYNFVSDEQAYAVDGTAQIVDGQVQSLNLRRPNRVWASIDTYYSE